MYNFMLFLPQIVDTEVSGDTFRERRAALIEPFSLQTG